jgi:flagellin
MGLSVQTNLAALNAANNLTKTQNQLTNSLQKLSSGFRINTAADDAAGLAISEGMRSQMGGITVGIRNAQDGISVVQTAEGALNETTSILQRMRDLSVQGANSGALTADAKSNIQTEITKLKTTLDNIGTNTKFNGQSLLTGSYNADFQVGANVGETIKVAIGTDASSTGLGVSGVDVTAVASNASTAVTTNATAGVAGNVAVAGDFSTAATLAANIKGLNGTLTVGTKSIDLAEVAKTATSIADVQTAIDGVFGKTAGTSNVGVAGSVTALTFTGTAPAAGATAAEVAAASPSFAQASGATEAINLIDKAIAKVSTERANLGATQNQFDHTINNANVALQNVTASESRIRDTDMAATMVDFTKSQILSQAGTAMLAQAKSLPQDVLKLLQ